MKLGCFFKDSLRRISRDALLNRPFSIESVQIALRNGYLFEEQGLRNIIKGLGEQKRITEMNSLYLDLLDLPIKMDLIDCVIEGNSQNEQMEELISIISKTHQQGIFMDIENYWKIMNLLQDSDIESLTRTYRLYREQFELTTLIADAMIYRIQEINDDDIVDEIVDLVGMDYIKEQKKERRIKLINQKLSKEEMDWITQSVQNLNSDDSDYGSSDYENSQDEQPQKVLKYSRRRSYDND